jgi:hypothetical protein
MASVGNVELSISQGSQESTRKVRVSFDLHFAAVDAGKRFRLIMMLFGENLPDDDRGPTSPQWLYTFLFGNSRHKLLIAEAGNTRIEETREINRSTLDEDPGFDLIRTEIDTWIRFPHKDEVYAQVTLIPEPCQSRSDTVELVF